MTAPCPVCRSELIPVLSGRWAFCPECSRARRQFAYASLGHASPPPFGLALGMAARDEGTARVLAGAEDWRDSAAAMIDDLARRSAELTADDVRAEALRVGLPNPPSANAWGAAMLAAGRRGVLRATDRLRASSRAAANAHRNPVHRSLIYQEA